MKHTLHRRMADLTQTQNILQNYLKSVVNNSDNIYLYFNHFYNENSLSLINTYANLFRNQIILGNSAENMDRILTGLSQVNITNIQINGILQHFSTTLMPEFITQCNRTKVGMMVSMIETHRSNLQSMLKPKVINFGDYIQSVNVQRQAANLDLLEEHILTYFFSLFDIDLFECLFKCISQHNTPKILILATMSAFIGVFSQLSFFRFFVVDRNKLYTLIMKIMINTQHNNLSLKARILSNLKNFLKNDFNKLVSVMPSMFMTSITASNLLNSGSTFLNNFTKVLEKGIIMIEKGIIMIEKGNQLIVNTSAAVEVYSEAATKTSEVLGTATSEVLDKVTGPNSIVSSPFFIPLFFLGNSVILLGVRFFFNALK